VGETFSIQFIISDSTMSSALVSDPLGLFGIAFLAFLLVYILVRLLTHKD
jgi:hypothetical protein